MKVYGFEHSLPALPLPELGDTCQSLKELIKPLVSPEIWDKACVLLDSFERGAGATLQQELLNWRQSRWNNSSWLRPVWDDSYLAFRHILPINMNYAFQLSKEWGQAYAGKLIWAAANILLKLNQGDLEPESAKSGYSSMDTLESMLYTRIPSSKRDVLYSVPLGLPLTMGVVCEGHWFILPLLDGEGAVLAPAAITAAIAKIKEQVKALPPAIPVSSFTSAQREEAFMVRSRLQENLQNRVSLESLEKTAFILCLDKEQSPVVAKDFLTGDPACRWFDKSLQFILNPEGVLGVNIEHAGCDAAIWTYFFNQADAYIKNADCPQKISVPDICLLKWQVDGDLKAKLISLQREFQALADSLSYAERKISSAAKGAIKAKKCSPDFFIQLLFQAAYYALGKGFRSAYEAVSTRSFYQGRTECVRPCSSLSRDFVVEFIQGQESLGALQERFRAAESVHKERIARAQKALGAERHLDGLYAMLQMTGGQTPAIYEDAGYLTLKHNALSTSSMTAAYIEFFGFGPVVEDGLGIGYGSAEHSLNLVVTAYPKSGIEAGGFIDKVEELAPKLLAILD